MRETYSSAALALRDALRHAVERSAASSFGTLHRRVPPESALTGLDGTAQAARIRRQLERLTPLSCALLVVAHAPRTLKCSCGARCCSGGYPNPEWEQAMHGVLVHVTPLLARRAANRKLHRAIIANALTRTKETTVSLAQRCGVHPHTVATHIHIIEGELIGTRQTAGRFDHASESIDALLREAGVVAD
ncbi:hypothetical protein [Paraburkholderia antibiotica]|uniref:DNA-binding protein n=1 Tax=Paraburkholderia antibiotica TaxID=2728839 RepID=A0A7X9X4G7_9BURK|nr:hypothetical protein [Paraburkholderia antibiotica]NML31230.1 hypothetical protein [Paraburkholderia antibiotica]